MKRTLLLVAVCLISVSALAQNRRSARAIRPQANQLNKEKQTLAADLTRLNSELETLVRSLSVDQRLGN